MSNMLKTDASAADAWVEIELAPQADVWLTYDVYFDPASLALMLSSGGGWFSMIYPIAEADPTTDAFGVSGGGWAPGPGAPVGGVWMTIEHHHVTASVGDIYLNGGLLVNQHDFASSDADRVRIGQYNTFGLTPSLLYFDNVKVGTTRGASDLFADDFESGNLSAWTTTSGAVSVFNPDASIVTFDASGGSGTMAPQAASSPAALTTNSFTRTGFTFGGWNTAADGSGTAYADGAVYSFAADVTLYAQWLPPPVPESPAGVYIAFGDDTLTTTPGYVPVQNVQMWETHRGRQYELDKTQAGTAVITVIDEDGLFDPTNSASSLFGLIGPLSPAQIRAVDPLTQETYPIFTGFVESWTYKMDTTERWMVATINLTDGFEILARAEVIPEAPAPPPLPAGHTAGVTTYDASRVDDRIRAALGDAGWPALLTNIFTGNVILQSTIYNPQSSLLGVIQDAADAEFPNVANVFMDKWGRVAFRGRWARFRAEFYSPRVDGMNAPLGPNQVNFWDVGDRFAADTFGIAPISDIEWNLDLKNVINACLCMPYGIHQNDIAGQLRPTSFPTPSTTKYGLRSFSIPDLVVSTSIDNPTANPGGDGSFTSGTDANGECQIFGEFYVSNYSTSIEMISSITFKSLDPSDSLAAPLWKFVTQVEIGDVVTVHTNDPGGGGFKATQFFVEGVHNTVTNDLRGDVLAWQMNLDLTPRMWYSVFNGVTYYP